METLESNAKRLSPKEQYQRRTTAVRMLSQGYTVAQAAKAVGISRTTVYSAQKLYEEKGIEGLEPKTRGRRTGDHRLLTPDQEQEITEAIIDRTPEEFKLKCCLWTRKAVQEYIRLNHKIKLIPSTLGYYLERWGFSSQRPTRRANRQDEVRVARWKEEEYPAIEQKARLEKADIYWGDETAIQNTANYIKGYAPIGKTPVLKIEARKLKLNMISAVSNRGQLRFMISRESINTEKLLEFMKRLVKDNRRKVLLILDNLRVHHSRRVREWLAEHREEIELFFLPPYAPEYNPDEYLNSDLKREMSKLPIPKSEEELRSNARSVLKRTQLNPKRVQGYFGTKFTKYAA